VTLLCTGNRRNFACDGGPLCVLLINLDLSWTAYAALHSALESAFTPATRSRHDNVRERKMSARMGRLSSDFISRSHPVRADADLFDYGVNFYDISNPAKLSLIPRWCARAVRAMFRVSNLLFMSVEMPNGRLDCGVQAFPPLPPPAPGHEKDHRIPTASPDRFRGVRVFDISDIKNPKQVAAVQTCRGSHTHTLVVDPNDRDNVYIYVSGTSFVCQSEELAGCSGEEKPEKDPNTSLFRIDVIKVPLAAQQQAKVVSSPRVFIDPRTGALNGLNNGGSHDKRRRRQGHQPVPRYHGVFGLRACCWSVFGQCILLDIKDPVHPKRVDAVNDPNYSYWHSASFSNDGTKVVSPTSGAAVCSRAAAQPIPTNGELTPSSI